MKTKKFAVIAIISVFLLVLANSITLHFKITGFLESAAELDVFDDGALFAAEKIKESFEAGEGFISLTVNHEDLTNIEVCYSDLIGYLSVGMTKEAEVTKNRLVDALKHLRRLSGVNIDSII